MNIPTVIDQSEINYSTRNIANYLDDDQIEQITDNLHLNYLDEESY